MSLFVKIRTALIELIESGEMSMSDLAVYTLVQLQTNPTNGIWRGSGAKICAVTGWNLRSAQRSLKRLEGAKLIRCWRKRPGARGNYVVWIDQFEPYFGALRGHRLNAWGSDVCSNPRYDLVAEDVAESDAEVSRKVFRGKNQMQTKRKTKEPREARFTNSAQNAEFTGSQIPFETQTANTANQSPLDLLSHQELKGLHTTLERSLRNRRLPGGLRRSFEGQLAEVKVRIGGSHG